MHIKTFMPSALTVKIAATTASNSIALDTLGNTVRVVNAGASLAFIHFSKDPAYAATNGNMPIAAGATETFTKGAASYVAAIAASGTTDIYFTVGEGL